MMPPRLHGFTLGGSSVSRVHVFSLSIYQIKVCQASTGRISCIVCCDLQAPPDQLLSPASHWGVRLLWLGGY